MGDVEGREEGRNSSRFRRALVLSGSVLATVDTGETVVEFPNPGIEVLTVGAAAGIGAAAVLGDG